MTGKQQKLKPDTVLKNYWNDNEQFADLFNAVLFQGREVIKPEELEDVDTEESSILEHREYAESLDAARDNIKVHKKSEIHGVQFVMLGLESQEHIHYAMPMRVMGYDYGVYKKQYDSNAKSYKTAQGLSADEYLSRMKKTDKFMPVITVVVYYGEKPWDGAKALHEMLHISPELAEYVNDYKMLLVEARQSGLVLNNGNNRDLFELLKIILDRSIPGKQTRQKAMEYAAEHNVDKSVVMTVAGATRSNLDYHVFEKGADNMCTLFEEIAEEGRIEGREEGRIEGRAEGEIKGRAEGEIKGRAEGRAAEIIDMGCEFGLSRNDILERLQKKLDVSLQTAQEYFEMFGKQTV